MDLTKLPLKGVDWIWSAVEKVWHLISAGFQNLKITVNEYPMQSFLSWVGVSVGVDELIPRVLVK